MTKQAEVCISTTPAFAMPIAPRAPRVTRFSESFSVVDNPGIAWAYSDQSPYTSLHSDLVNDYRDLLDLAATELIGPLLATVWEQRGYRISFGTRAEVETSALDDALYHSVWDEAASHLDPDLIVRHADLDDIRHTYS